MVKIAHLSLIDIAVAAVGVESAMQIYQLGIQQGMYGVFFAIGIQVAHDEQVLVVKLREVVVVVSYDRLCFLHSVSIELPLSVALVGIHPCSIAAFGFEVVHR